ncbi:MAG TPA: PRC-barrel domain containing protein [Archaeoglobaceae archaeon]|nr:PRC-barrel domain containing protein [Archaeoglobaceae archaeon]
MLFAKSLGKKVVLLSDGTVVGSVYNVTMDLKTGSLIDIVVKPQNEIPEVEKQNGLYIIPFESVKSVSDYVVLDRRKLRI